MDGQTEDSMIPGGDLHRICGGTEQPPALIYEDADLLVCRKPAGLPVQSRQVGQMDLESMVRGYLAGCAGTSGAAGQLSVVHRLDQPVEGLVVFAKNKKAAAGLSAQLTDGRMHKEYLALCCEIPAENGKKTLQIPAAKGQVQARTIESGGLSVRGAADGGAVTLADYLKKDARTNMSRIVPRGTPGAKRAELTYTVEETVEAGAHRYYRVRIRLHTGRHHQIRVQMAGAGLPLYGDRKYNPSWEMFRQQDWEEDQKTPLALCACRLTFLHPVTGEQMEFHVRPSFCS